MYSTPADSDGIWATAMKFSSLSAETKLSCIPQSRSYYPA